MARVFASHGRSSIELYVFRGTSLLSGREIIPVQNFIKWALVQYRGTILLGGRKLSRLQKVCKWVVVRIRVQHALQICLGGRIKSKNRDKLIYFIDRVSKCAIIIFMIQLTTYFKYDRN